MSNEDLPSVIENLLKRTMETGVPNCHRLNEKLRTFPYALANIKTIAYETARLQRASEGKKPAKPILMHAGLRSALCTAGALESPWALHWLEQLNLTFAYHRKNWEICYVLQALYEGLSSFENKRGLGFGCGSERIPAYLASRGARVEATDAPPDMPGIKSWSETNQYASGKDALWMPDLISKDRFDSGVSFNFVDMNQIPPPYQGQFDFCWSICALEHLGSIEKGLQFMVNSLSVLKPGGTAVHTMEFNLDEGETIDNWPTVLFQRKHMEELGRLAEGAGGNLLPPDYNEGDTFYDRYVDTPPYDVMKNEIHLKLDIDGFRCTCMGVILRKR